MKSHKICEIFPPSPKSQKISVREIYGVCSIINHEDFFRLKFIENTFIISASRSCCIFIDIKNPYISAMHPSQLIIVLLLLHFCSIFHLHFMYRHESNTYTNGCMDIMMLLVTPHVCRYDTRYYMI